MEMIKLKNGAEVPKPLAQVLMMSLTSLWNDGISGITTCYDLVQICKRDPKYKKFGTNEDTLKRLSLIGADGQPHEYVRDVVLSAFTGEGLDLQLDSPVAE